MFLRHTLLYIILVLMGTDCNTACPLPVMFHCCRGRQTYGKNARVMLKHGTIDFFWEYSYTRTGGVKKRVKKEGIICEGRGSGEDLSNKSPAVRVYRKE